MAALICVRKWARGLHEPARASPGREPGPRGQAGDLLQHEGDRAACRLGHQGQWRQLAARLLQDAARDAVTGQAGQSPGDIDFISSGSGGHHELVRSR
jgi:hypothetical protein